MKPQLPKKSSKFFAIVIVLISLAIAGALIAAGVLFFISTRTARAAVVTNGIECAAMGKKILQRGGSVADAAVTVVLCEGITCPQSSGVGGGFLLTFYSKREGIVRTLDAREVAPGAAAVDMYVGNDDSLRGGKAVAVPGEIKGLWELHQEFGKLSWKELLQPVIQLCRMGHIVSPYLENIFKSSENDILAEPSLREIFINPLTNKTYQLGERIRRPKLAETLEIIAEQGADAIYGEGEIGRKMAEDTQKYGGILTVQDLKNYRVYWSSSLSSTIVNNYTLHTFPLPSSGALLNYIFNILANYDLSELDSLTYHRTVEAFKFAYAKRSHLGDDNSTEVLAMMHNLMSVSYADETAAAIDDTRTYDDVRHYGALYEDVNDQGTAHMSILAPNGDAIAVTNTINYRLGAFFRSQQTGIIMNNEMDDFSTPGAANVYGILPSPANFIAPGKRPMSSMIPTIVVDRAGDVRMIVGAAGGSRIPTGIFAAIFNHIYKGQSLEEALQARRLHHQLGPSELQWETGFNGTILEELRTRFGHTLMENLPDGGFAAVTGIAVKDGKIEASFDPRRGGGAEVF